MRETISHDIGTMIIVVGQLDFKVIAWKSQINKGKLVVWIVLAAGFLETKTFLIELLRCFQIFNSQAGMQHF